MAGSRVQIAALPVLSFVIVYGIVQNYGVSGLIIATFMAGIMLIIMGFAKLGMVIKFIPHPPSSDLRVALRCSFFHDR